MTRKEDSVVLSYFDCIIRDSDIKILKNNGWLTDAIIGFYFVYLEKMCLHLNNHVLFVGPEVTQCLKESPASELPVFLDPLEAKEKDYLFMAVNDSGKSDGGSHWSLLVFCRYENSFYHLDSSSQTNYYSALKLAHNVWKYLNTLAEINFIELASLQQNNCYDCGIYLICNIENLVEHLTHGGVISNAPFIKKEVVSNKRKDILGVIDYCKMNS